ncbi:hypothetical protein MHB43_31920 [Paenibacillus sp. FSL H8-0317]
MEERYNEICELGIEDIQALNDHIEDWFNLENKMPIFPEDE